MSLCGYTSVPWPQRWHAIPAGKDIDVEESAMRGAAMPCTYQNAQLGNIGGHRENDDLCARPAQCDRQGEVVVERAGRTGAGRAGCCVIAPAAPQDPL